MGGPEFSQTYEEQLRNESVDQFENFQRHNEGKNIFSAARTPAVLFTVMIVCYMISGVFSVIGLESISNIFNFSMIIFLMMLCSWFYIQYSGEYRNLAIQIDQISTVIWDHVSMHALTNIFYPNCIKSTSVVEWFNHRYGR